MRFQILSHAGLMVEAGGVQLLCDPWLVGSSYWRSWWNYPPVPADLVAELKPDAIYLTHLHWDHFHGPSLKLFPPDTLVIVPYDRYDRMVRDLATVGMTNVIELAHGQTHAFASGFKLTSYHFSPFVTDSAAVIEADGVTILNANDAKLMGGPLDQILQRHPIVDFALRSHTSANPRANYHLTDAVDEVTDDVTQYLHSFALFMRRVAPRVAIPFASNNCLLHDDSFAQNPIIQTPLMVRDYFERYASEHGLSTKLQVMVPGDSWSSEAGFEISDKDWFSDRAAHLDAYRERVRPTLERQAAIEARIGVPMAAVEKFVSKLSRNLPGLLRRRLRGFEALLVSRSAKRVDGFAVDLSTGSVRSVAEADFASFDARIEFPALILLQSLRLNMFGHAAISRRVNYHATRASMPKLQRFAQALELSESELLPLSRNFSKRSIRAAMPRWREALLYSSVAVQLARGRPLMKIEERLLRA
jgi:UDP-MurNAc hydroxylase